MPMKRSKPNYRAAAHSDALAELSVQVHKSVIKGSYVSSETLDTLIRLVNDLARELRPASAVDTSDPFLTEGPKPSDMGGPKQADVARLPTVQVPTVEKPVEKQKSGFLGR